MNVFVTFLNIFYFFLQLSYVCALPAVSGPPQWPEVLEIAFGGTYWFVQLIWRCGYLPHLGLADLCRPMNVVAVVVSIEHISSCIWLSVSGSRFFRPVSWRVPDQCAKCRSRCHHRHWRHQHQTDHTRFRRFCHCQLPFLLLYSRMLFMCKLLVAYNITGFGFNSSPFNVPVFRTHRVSQCEKNIQLPIIFADIVQYLKLISFI